MIQSPFRWELCYSYPCKRWVHALVPVFEDGSPVPVLPGRQQNLVDVGVQTDDEKKEKHVLLHSMPKQRPTDVVRPMMTRS